MDPAEHYTVSQLAERSGISVATIKFYVREGLPPGGDLRRARRAYYGAVHLQRLALIRALRTVAGLPVAVIRRLLRTVARASADAVEVIAPAVDALAAMRRLGDPSLPADVLAPYLEAIRPLTEQEIANAVRNGVFATNARAVEVAVLGTVLWEPVLTAFRRLWHEHLTTQLVQPERRE